MLTSGRHPEWMIGRVLVAFTALITALVVPGAASATPRPSLEEVRQRIQALHHEAESATERHNAMKEEIAGLNVRLTASRTRITEQQAALTRARLALGRLAADTYKAGDLDTLSLFLGDDPDQYVGANALLVSLGERRTEAVSDLQHQRRLLVAAMTDIQAQQQRLDTAQRQLRASQRDVERKLAEAEAELNRLTGDERTQLARGDRSRYRDGLEEQGVTLPPSGRLACDDVPPSGLGARVSKVIGYACAQVGDRYQWGGSGPSRFDCSGLTMMAWKQAGVSLPHNAAMQATYGTTAGLDDLEPGDLVFFFRPIGHNGIYLGNGLMIHAPQTGDAVKIAPIRSVGSLTTAVRL